jgi:hypothetical protein
LRSVVIRDSDDADESFDSYLTLVARALGGEARGTRAHRA